jgi:hypothetical protein
MIYLRPVMATKSDFMAAEDIKAILHGRDKIEQERIIRWVTESLGLVAVPSFLSGTPAPPAAVPATPPAHTHPAVTPPHRSKDIKTFLNEKNPKSDVQFAAVAAYFYRFESSSGERKEVIVPQDLDQAGRQARGYSFKDARKTLNNAVMLGYFDRAGDGQFKLNAVGENLVAMTLPGASGGENGSKIRRAKRK